MVSVGRLCQYGRLRVVSWLNPGVLPQPTLAGWQAVNGDWYVLMGAFASAFATPMHTGDNESLAAGEA